MVQLITDRSQYHVELLKRLYQKNWADMTASEQAAWYGEAAKGSYNHTDLNRVETAVAELATELGLTLTTKTDWGVWDFPTQSQMERYLGNVVAIRDAVSTKESYPDLPGSMDDLTFEAANNIEKTLDIAYRTLRPTLGTFILGTSTLMSE